MIFYTLRDNTTKTDVKRPVRFDIICFLYNDTIIYPYTVNARIFCHFFQLCFATYVIVFYVHPLCVPDIPRVGIIILEDLLLVLEFRKHNATVEVAGINRTVSA